MTNTRAFNAPENRGVFVILSTTGVICPLGDQFPAQMSFSRGVDDEVGQLSAW